MQMEQPHPSQGLIQGWHERSQNPLISCLCVPVTTFPGAGMAILVLHLVTVPFLCQVWMPPPKPEAALEHRGARCCPLTANSSWKTPKNSQNYICLAFCNDGSAPGRILGRSRGGEGAAFRCCGPSARWHQTRFRLNNSIFGISHFLDSRKLGFLGCFSPLHAQSRAEGGR